MTATLFYDNENVFAKILRKEIASHNIMETAMTLAFHDAFPKAPIHALVIPKGSYRDFHDFSMRASSEEILDFWATVSRVVLALSLEHDGYRMLSNCGEHGGQEVPHFHVHICGGKKLGPIC